MKERPILFNGEMVRAILDGRKTQTRREVKNPDRAIEGCDISGLIDQQNVIGNFCPYGKVGDRLWVRETFSANEFMECKYAASHERPPCGWTPSIHMPRWASRITLEITNVRVDRLQDISETDAAAEGMIFTDYGLTCFHQGAAGDVGNCPAPDAHHQKRPGWSWKPTTHQDQCYHTAKYAFGNLWDSIYQNWNANPWVWVIEFKVVK